LSPTKAKNLKHIYIEFAQCYYIIFTYLLYNESYSKIKLLWLTCQCHKNIYLHCTINFLPGDGVIMAQSKLHIFCIICILNILKATQIFITCMRNKRSSQRCDCGTNKTMRFNSSLRILTETEGHFCENRGHGLT